MNNQLLITQINLDELKAHISECVKSALQNSTKGGGDMDEDFINQKEVQKILGVSAVTLNKWRKEKSIPYYRFGTRIRYKRSEIVKKQKYEGK